MKPPLTTPNRHVLTFVAILSLSATLRALLLGRTSFIPDEMHAIDYATHGFAGGFFWDNSPPLYYLILRIYLGLVGYSEFGARSLSVIFSVAATFLWCRFGKNRWGSLGLWTFGIAHALLPISIYFSRITRTYALFELASTLMLIVVMRAIENKKTSSRTIWFTMIFNGLAHYVSVVPLFATAMLVWQKKRPSKALQTLAKAAGTSGIIGLCGIVFSKWYAVAWQTSKFAIEPESRWPMLVFMKATGGWPALVAIVIIALMARRPWSEVQKFLVQAFFLSLVAVTAIGFLSSKSFFAPRYFVYLGPFLVGFLGTTICSWWELRRQWRGKIAIGFFALLLLNNAGSSAFVLARSSPDWRLAVNAIASSSDPTRNIKVFTSESVAIRSPYFVGKNLLVEKLRIKTEDSPAEQLIAASTEGYVTWLIDLKERYDLYKNRLSSSSDASCLFNDYSIAKEGVDTLILFKVSCYK